jgi:hypothetical protein
LIAGLKYFSAPSANERTAALFAAVGSEIATASSA